MVVVLRLLLIPSLLDCWEGGASIAAGVDIRNWQWGPLLRVEDSRVGEVEVAGVDIGARPFSEPVLGVLTDVGKNVGADVPSAEGEEVPGRYC